jgi:hypothetical protein
MDKPRQVEHHCAAVEIVCCAPKRQREGVMTDLLFVFVRSNAAQAEALAALFVDAGLSISADPATELALAASSASIVLWSDAASRSNAFLAAAQRAIEAQKAVMACFSPPPSRRIIGDTPVFDLSGWKGNAADPLLTPLLLAVNYIVESKRDEVVADALGAAAPSWTADLPEAPIGRVTAEVTALRPTPSDDDPDNANLVA